MRQVLLKAEKGKTGQNGIEEFWNEVEAHMKNPGYAKTARFTHKYLTGRI